MTYLQPVVIDILDKLDISRSTKGLFYAWVKKWHKDYMILRCFINPFKTVLNSSIEIDKEIISLIQELTFCSIRNWKESVYKFISSISINQVLTCRLLGKTYWELYNNKALVSFVKRKFHNIFLINLTKLIINCYRTSLVFNYKDLPFIIG